MAPLDRAENMTGKELALFFEHMPQDILQGYLLRGSNAAIREMKKRKKSGTWDHQLGMKSISSILNDRPNIK